MEFYQASDGYFYPIVYDDMGDAYFDRSQPYDSDGNPVVRRPRKQKRSTRSVRLDAPTFLGHVRSNGVKVAYDQISDTAAFVWNGVQYILPFLSSFL